MPLDPDNLAVTCRGLTKTFRTGGQATPALRGIDLDVRKGELMLLAGPSGCGKTTLISVIAGILDRDGGECSVLGHDFNSMSGSRRATMRRRDIGFVFQQFNLLPTLTAAENVAIPLLINFQPRHRSIQKAKAMLEKVGIPEKVNSYPRQLSGGQQQRVAIARALVHSPRLVVCDEPTSALDHASGDRIMQILREIALQDGRSLIVVTHDSRIFQYADRVARMDDGRVVGIESMERKVDFESKELVSR